MSAFREVTLSIDGVLNGLPPFKADYVFDDHYKPDTDSLDDAYAAVQWCVVDAEGSILARVDGGEEMAEYMAYCLNELEGRRLVSGTTLAWRNTSNTQEGHTK